MSEQTTTEKLDQEYADLIARPQLEKYGKWDESKHPRSEGGKFTGGARSEGVASKEDTKKDTPKTEDTARTEETGNTATLRSRASDSKESGDYEEAAKLYDLAADRYPDQGGQMAKHDIANLRQRAKEARSMIPDRSKGTSNPFEETELTDERKRRVSHAIVETQELLDKERRYKEHLQDKSLINFYKQHLAKLQRMGKPPE